MFTLDEIRVKTAFTPFTLDESSAMHIRSVKCKFAQRKDGSVTFHWVKGHSGLKGNERVDYLVKIVASYKPTTTYDTIPESRGKWLLEEYYIKIWNAAYINSEKASHTKPPIPSILHRMTLTLWPNHILTQFLTNNGCFHLYLYKRKKASTALCSCPEKAEQMAWHLMSDCSLFSKERPAVFRKLTLPQIMQCHINMVEVSRLIKNIYHMLQEQSKSDQTVNHYQTTNLIYH
jgi:hypothetical protein